jgi:hypothetical protein
MEFAIEERSIRRWAGLAIWPLMAKLARLSWRLHTLIAWPAIMGSPIATSAAWVAARLFLVDNGRRIRFNPGDAVKTMESVASGTVGEAALAAWFRRHLKV